MLPLLLIFDAIFWLGILAEFATGFFSEDDEIMVKRPAQIASRYASTWYVHMTSTRDLTAHAHTRGGTISAPAGSGPHTYHTHLAIPMPVPRVQSHASPHANSLLASHSQVVVRSHRLLPLLLPLLRLRRGLRARRHKQIRLPSLRPPLRLARDQDLSIALRTRAPALSPWRERDDTRLAQLGRSGACAAGHHLSVALSRCWMVRARAKRESSPPMVTLSQSPL